MKKGDAKGGHVAVKYFTDRFLVLIGLGMAVPIKHVVGTILPTRLQKHLNLSNINNLLFTNSWFFKAN